MSAKISNLFICPKCGEAMSHPEKPQKCPKCNHKFAKDDEKMAVKFEWHKAPTRQLFEIIQQDMEKYKDKPLSLIVKDLGIILTKEQEEELADQAITNEMRHGLILKFRTKQMEKFLLATHEDDINETFQSLLRLMKLVLSSGNPELVKMVGIRGREVGKLSEVLENYLKAGGEVHDARG